MSAHHKIKVIIDGNPYLVELGTLSGPRIIATVNGKVYDVEVGSVTDDSAAAGDFGSAVDRQSGGETKSSGIVSSVSVITAPLPGIIANIEVSAGDLIVKDQLLCFLEAMKMQNAIRSPRDGVIASVGIVAGQAVTYGDVLFTFE